MNKIVLTLGAMSCAFMTTLSYAPSSFAHNHASEDSSSPKLSIERIFDSPALQGSSLRNVQVSPNGDRVTFTRGKESDYTRYDLWEYHIESGETRILFDSDDLFTGEENLSDEEKARRERMRVFGSGIISYNWAPDGKALIFPLAGDVYYYRLGDESAKKLVETPEFETDVKVSPKGKYISYVREQNLYIMDIETGKETAVTTGGEGDIKYAMAEFVAQEEMSRMTGYWWSPDESHIALTKVDNSPVMTITRSEIYADSIKMIEQKYPKAGTDNALIDLAVYNLKDTSTTWLDLGKERDIYLARVDWQSNEQLTYQIQSRDQKQLTLNQYSLDSKATKVLLEEKNDTWINLHYDLVFLKNGDFIWASERDGFMHLYHYDNSGKLERQLTSGDWVVTGIKALDRDSNTLYFEGRKDTVLENHLYALNLTEVSIKRVSEPGFYHSTVFSDDASIFVNRRSNTDTPQQTSLHKNDGSLLTWLSKNEVTEGHPLHPYKANWITPTFGKISTDDGVDLHYRMYKPKKLEGKHPVIVYTYGGPGVQVVNNRWAGNRGLMFQHWANKGYIVFSLDNRGSKYRGKAFEDPIYHAMGDIEIQDQIRGVEYLRTLPYVDSSRIGIHGHSYGGYMTIMAMFKGADYFAAGASGAPVTDWLLYDTHYTERYMGDPRQVPDAYTASSVFPYADNLKGDLLILHGMADDNVLFTHATKLYKHLQDNAKPFYVMDYPGKKHGIRGKNTSIHMFTTITNFFDTHLGAHSVSE